MTCIDKIYSIIENGPKRMAYCYKDFKECGNYDNIRQSVKRLTEKKMCKMILPGIFYQPTYNKILNQEISPSTGDIAKALARNFDWIIYPDTLTLENKFGLSTQVPNKKVYISTGPSREYKIFNKTIIFKHSNQKFLYYASYKSCLLFLALKNTKSKTLTPLELKRISSILSENDFIKIQEDKKYAPKWMHGNIELIIKKRKEVSHELRSKGYKEITD